MWIVKLDSKCWLANWRGDPGRTVCIENAKRYKTAAAAKAAITRAKKYRELRNAEIVKVDD